MKLFLDTNALLDYFTQRQPFFEDMKKLRIAQYFGDVEFWASPLSFTDAEYILRGALPVSEIRSMMANSLSFISIVPPSASNLAAGLDSSWPDLENFLIACCAKTVSADYIITRDANGFASSEVPAITAAEWMVLQEKEGIYYDEVEL